MSLFRVLCLLLLSTVVQAAEVTYSLSGDFSPSYLTGKRVFVVATDSVVKDRVVGTLVKAGVSLAERPEEGVVLLLEGAHTSKTGRPEIGKIAPISVAAEGGELGDHTAVECGSYPVRLGAGDIGVLGQLASAVGYSTATVLKMAFASGAASNNTVYATDAGCGKKVGSICGTYFCIHKHVSWSRLVLVEQGNETLWAVLETTASGSGTKGAQEVAQAHMTRLEQFFSEGR